MIFLRKASKQLTVHYPETENIKKIGQFNSN